MGTIADKLEWLYNRKKDLVTCLGNSKKYCGDANVTSSVLTESSNLSSIISEIQTNVLRLPKILAMYNVRSNTVQYIAPYGKYCGLSFTKVSASDVSISGLSSNLRVFGVSIAKDHRALVEAGYEITSNAINYSKCTVIFRDDQSKDDVTKYCLEAYILVIKII